MKNNPRLLGFSSSAVLWGSALLLMGLHLEEVAPFETLWKFVSFVATMVTLWAIITFTFTAISDIFGLKGEKWRMIRPPDRSQKFCEGAIIPFVMVLLPIIIREYIFGKGFHYYLAPLFK